MKQSVAWYGPVSAITKIIVFSWSPFWVTQYPLQSLETTTRRCALHFSVANLVSACRRSASITSGWKAISNAWYGQHTIYVKSRDEMRAKWAASQHGWWNIGPGEWSGLSHMKQRWEVAKNNMWMANERHVRATYGRGLVFGGQRRPLVAICTQCFSRIVSANRTFPIVSQV